jgi:hypothetical protein
MSNDRPGPAPTPPDSGVEGNSRLTSTNGMLLLGLLAVEGLTLLSVRRMITLHVFLGVLLIGPVLLKTGSTAYRFARYYTGSRAYLDKGPPHWLLRTLGPVVVLSSLLLLGTGVGLLAVKPADPGLLLSAHKASFVIWVAVMTLHVLGHVRGGSVTAWRELRGSTDGPGPRGRALRLTAVVLALVLGVVTATVVLPTASPWTTRTSATHDR